MKANKLLLLLLLLVLSFRAQAQEQLDPQKYTGNLIEYFTEVNIWLEGHMLVNYCQCSTNDEFLLTYQQVRSSYNAFLNSHINQLVLLNSRKALNSFKQMNTSDFIRMHPGINEAYTSLIRFGELRASDCENTPFLPTVISVAELTQIASSVLDIFNDARKRRDEQKLVIIQSLEGFKIPSIQGYECTN